MLDRRVKPEATMSVHPTVMPEPLDAGQMLTALNAFKKGDFSVRLPEEWTGIAIDRYTTLKEGTGQ